MSDADLIQSFVQRYLKLEEEGQNIAQMKKDLWEEYKAKGLPMRSITAAMQIVRQYRNADVPRNVMETYVEEVEKVL